MPRITRIFVGFFVSQILQIKLIFLLEKRKRRKEIKALCCF